MYDTPEYDGAGVTELQTLEFTEDEMILHVISYTYEDEDFAPLRLKLTFKNIVDYSISQQSWDYFRETGDSSLLISYETPQSEIYIKKKPEQLEIAYVKCIRALDQLIPKKENGLNVIGLSASSLLRLLTRGFGHIASGPATFIDALSIILKEHGAHPSTLPKRSKSKSWEINGNYGHTPYDQRKLRVMTFGENWVLYEVNED